MKNNAYKRPDLINPQQTINENFKQVFQWRPHRWCSLKDLGFWLLYWHPQFVRAMLSTINKGFITIYKLITCSYRLRCTFSFGHWVVCSSSIYGSTDYQWRIQTCFSMETTSMMLWITLPKEDYKKSLKIPKR
jgi:hypothetical protein